MHREDLFGTWSLESCIAKGSNGAEVFPLGEAPRGLLTYTADGYMSAVIMNSGLQKFASSDHRGGTPGEIKQAFEEFDAYAGTYELDEENGTVAHHAEVARLPNWEGTTQVRYARLVGSKLHLETAPLLSRGQEWVVSLAFLRAGSAQA